jgi:glycosyltransferase involved in cell wall biosynthesis/SAM-dependent methyltransferase
VGAGDPNSDEKKMNLLIVNHSALVSNSGNHVSCLASELVKLGHKVAVAVPNNDFVATAAGAVFACITWTEAESYSFPDGKRADLVHAWTPRQHVASATRRIVQAQNCSYVVHLEDNEHAIAALNLGTDTTNLISMAKGSRFALPIFLAHPVDMKNFIARSIGVSVLMDRLFEFKPPELLGVEIWPSADTALFTPRASDQQLRARLGIRIGAKVLVYHGNVHPANVAEVRSLYLAVAALARSGIDLILVRLGEDSAEVITPELSGVQAYIVKVPFQTRERLPLYLSLADLFVQPGRIDEFNAYRFPSKVPEFLAMGRPVILPFTNIGTRLEDGEEALLLQTGDALEIAAAIRRVLSDEALSRHLAAGARNFFDRCLSWSASAAKLDNFYVNVLVGAGMDNLNNNVAARNAGTYYRSQPVPPALGYATVQDYSESIDRIGALARINHDLKDAQRPWIFKTILSAVKQGGRLLEIGAGDPWVADLLARLGYEVTVVDPYDGTARGPDQFETIRKKFPNITFVRGFFPEALASLKDKKFDCIYSISVLEHLPIETIPALCAGIRAHSRSADAPTIHAIDHVLLGHGSEDHLMKLEAVVRGLGMDTVDLHAMLARLDGDADAYFLSAESHNLWRGTVPYEKFPMRRCVSVQICSTTEGRALA